MKQRSPVTVVILTLLTFGIYGLVWHVQTKNELNRAYGAAVPTAWLLLVPFVGAIYWLWKWSEAAEAATETSGIAIFLLMVLLPVVGIPVMVSKFNRAAPVHRTPLRAAA